jgi:arsenate reductase
MAQGWANRLGGDCLEARSAGIEAHGLNTKAVAVMREAGADISTQPSSRVTPEHLGWADLVVTVCDHADQHCPVPPPGVLRQHWSLPDPARATGSEAEVFEVFRSSRDDIRTRVLNLIQSLHDSAAFRAG